MNKEERKQFIMQDLENKMKWLEENTSHNVIYLALQGSQNYEMDVYTDDYTSDIDAKAIILPSFEDILKGKEFYSHTYIMKDNSHIDVKDIRAYISLWKKANPSFLEILFTEFYICKNTKFKQILNMADDIARANIDKLLSCIKGMQKEKYAKLKHLSPATEKNINKYGYEPKQLHHTTRLFWMARDLILWGGLFRYALVIHDRMIKKMCLSLKTNPPLLKYAEELASVCVEQTKDLIDTYKSNCDLKVNEEVYEKMEDIVYDIVRDECVRSLRGG